MGFLYTIFTSEFFTANIMPLFTEGFAPMIIVALVAVAIIISFNSHKLFKVLVAVGGAVGAAYACYNFLLPLINVEFNLFNLGGLITLACAAVGAVIGYFLYIVGVFGIGALIGFSLSNFLIGLLVNALPDVAFLQNVIFYWVVCGIFAVGIGVLFAILFKHIIIIVPSIAVSTVAGLAVGLYIAINFANLPAMLDAIQAGTPMQTINVVLLYAIPAVFAVAGIVLAAFGIKRQYKYEKENA